MLNIPLDTNLTQGVMVQLLKQSQKEKECVVCVVCVCVCVCVLKKKKSLDDGVEQFPQTHPIDVQTFA